MADGLLTRFMPTEIIRRRVGVPLDDVSKADKYLRDALTADKNDGLRLAVRARWIALAVIGLLLPFLNFSWEMLYYEVLLLGFALLGWAMLHAGRVGTSRLELALIFLDLAFLTFTLVVPNPFADENWPTAMQYNFGNFIYFYVLLAAGTMAYTWRTVWAMGTWVTVLWLVAAALVIFFGTTMPELSAALAAVLSDQGRMIDFLDPNEANFPARVQEVVVFLIVAGILALNSWRNNQLLLKQAEVARERANLARHFPPTIVDQIASRDQPLGSVRSQSVTVMFADIVGFTRMAEKQSPAEVIALLRDFHGRMEAAVFNNHGTLDKFLGDGIMATFGTPDPSPEDSANALRCGLEMMATMDEWNRQRHDLGEAPIKLSIGIHKGDVVLGDIGSERRLEFATLGDTVNVANRLEALTRELDVRMIVSGQLVEDITEVGAADANELLSGLEASAARTLRGRDDPMTVWTYAGA